MTSVPDPHGEDSNGYGANEGGSGSPRKPRRATRLLAFLAVAVVAAGAGRDRSDPGSGPARHHRHDDDGPARRGRRALSLQVAVGQRGPRGRSMCRTS